MKALSKDAVRHMGRLINALSLIDEARSRFHIVLNLSIRIVRYRPSASNRRGQRWVKFEITDDELKLVAEWKPAPGDLRIRRGKGRTAGRFHAVDWNQVVDLIIQSERR